MKRITAAKADRLWRAVDAILECDEVATLPTHAQQSLHHLRDAMAVIHARGMENDARRGR